MNDDAALSACRRNSGTGRLRVVFLCAVLLLAGGVYARSQNTAGAQRPPDNVASIPDAPQPQDMQAVSVRALPINVLRDQTLIWTSPARIRMHDLVWLAPLSAATGLAIATDHHTMGSVVSHDSDLNHAADTASNVLVGTLAGAPAVLYGYGLFEKDAHAQETGLLGAEALGDAVVVEQGMKLIFWRERPSMDHGRGLFFQSNTGADSSFPSSHSVVAWSAAAVLAEEYHSRWMQVGVYSLATGVSLNRVLAQEHFPTDVLVGSAAGWLVGHAVYRMHHRHELQQHRTERHIHG